MKNLNSFTVLNAQESDQLKGGYVGLYNYLSVKGNKLPSGDDEQPGNEMPSATYDSGSYK